MSMSFVMPCLRLKERHQILTQKDVQGHNLKFFIKSEGMRGGHRRAGSRRVKVVFEKDQYEKKKMSSYDGLFANIYLCGLLDKHKPVVLAWGCLDGEYASGLMTVLKMTSLLFWCCWACTAVNCTVATRARYEKGKA